MDEQAVPQEQFFTEPEAETPEVQAQEEDALVKDESVAALSEHPGWKLVKERMEEIIHTLKNSEVVDIQRSYEEVGREVIVNQLAARILQNQLEIIEEAAREVRARRRKRRVGK